MERFVLKSLFITGITAAASLTAFVFSGCVVKEPQTASLTVESQLPYQWFVEQDGDVFEIEKTDFADDGGSNMEGASIYDTFTLIPRKPGDATITFTYKVPEGGPSNYDDVTVIEFDLRADKNLHITELAQRSELPGDIVSVPEIPRLSIE